MAKLIDLDGLKTFLGGVKNWVNTTLTSKLANFVSKSGDSTIRGTLTLFGDTGSAIILTCYGSGGESMEPDVDCNISCLYRSDVYEEEPYDRGYIHISDVYGNDTNIGGIATPTENSDAANKAYVDGLVATATETEIDAIFE